MEHKFYILLFSLIIHQTQGFSYETLKNCCDFGTNFATKNKQCVSIPTPPSVQKADEIVCKNSLEVCCKTELAKNDCQLGLQDSKAGPCPPNTTPERKQCCEACSFGKLAASSTQSCNNFMGLGEPYNSHFKDCCEASLTTTTPQSPTKVTFADSYDPLPPLENLCDIGDLCAQICIPTDDSYRCDCNPGFALMTDGISCKEIKKQSLSKVDRCDTSNPCEHECIDTGVAIQCKCREGYQLDKDKRSCKDVDECALGVHTCLKNEICVNSIGYYECELEDDEEDSEANYGKECPEGYKFNGEKNVCDDIDECETPLICESGATCTNTVGSYKCIPGETICPPGFYFKDATQDCEDIDECVIGKHDCNRESQVCLNTKGNYTCTDKASKTNCPPGFKMNPRTQLCEDIDECVENPDICGENDICLNEPGGHNCLPYSTNLVNPERTTHVISQTTLPPTSRRTSNQPTTTTRRTTYYEPPPTTRRTTYYEPPPTTRKTTYYEPLPTTRKTTQYEPQTTKRTTPYEPPTTKRITHYASTTRRTTYNEPPTTSYTTYPTPSKTESTSYPTFNPNLYHTIDPVDPPPIPFNCPKGYKLDNKSKHCIDIDECIEDNNICDNYQDCYNTLGSYVCNCKTGFSKDPTIGACIDINECQIGTNDCSDGQRCDNTIGSYLCSRVAGCGTGYTLNYASGQCEDDNECELGTHNCDKLGPNMICRNTYGSYRCERKRFVRPTLPPLNYPIVRTETKKCLPGYYMTASGRCQDINECDSNPCSRGQKCLNRMGRYECIPTVICPPGFELNEAGDHCTDVDECARGIHACSKSQICKNHVGYHTCSCPPGHEIVNNECVDVNECEYFKDRICSTNSYCLNEIGSYKCICKDGFKEYGNKCIDIDECEESSGLCHQNCVNVWGGYRCSCERGFMLNDDNRTCSDVNECVKFSDKNLCVGTCENTPGSYICRCPAGYKIGSDGRTCQDIDECISNPCHSRDTICVNTRGGFECPSIACPPYYVKDPNHKSRCKKDTNLCKYANCQNSPAQYTYHFFTLVSKLPFPSGPLKFFQMSGPAWETSTSRFNLILERATCPSHVEKVNPSFFKVHREPQKAYILFTKPIEGPQEIELSFEMELDNVGLKFVAKIIIFVTQYSF